MAQQASFQDAPQGLPAGWLIPDWPAIAGVHALCTARDGGVSQGPYASMNLGSHVGDAPEAVQENRARLQAVLGLQTPGTRPVFLSQVHGTDVVALDACSPDGLEADACLTTQRGPVCTIMVADCLPVLLAHRSGAVVAAAHAGWRGLAGQGAAEGVAGRGVLESVVDTICSQIAAVAQANQAQGALENIASEGIAGDIQAWLGPCIGPRAFEVGAEVRQAFLAWSAHASVCFAPVPDAPGKWLADLPALARLRLQALGVTRIYGNDGSDAWCTYTQALRFFSHRRDTALLGGSGRLAACVWLG
jgi:copper oxidase (laccase) domain-containing protein